MTRCFARCLSRRFSLGLALLALGATTLLTGCIRSRVTIDSQPQGAEVIWRGQPRGATPIEIPFIWYWHYDFALEKPGYKRKEVSERFRTKPWFLMPVDLFMEIIPVPIPDKRYRKYTLEPAPAGMAAGQPATVISPETLGLIQPQTAK